MQEEEQNRGPLIKNERWMDKRVLALTRLSQSSAITQGNTQAAFAELTAMTASILQTERVSIWLFNEQQTKIECADLFVRSTQTHATGSILNVEQCPAYFVAIKEKDILSAPDAWNDQRTKGFRYGYLDILNIFSRLDASFSIDGEIRGIICCEQVGKKQYWSDGDQYVAQSVANLITLTLEAKRYRTKNVALQYSEARANATFEQASIGFSEIGWDAPNFIRVNQCFCDLLGYTQAELMGMTVADITHPDDIAASQVAIQMLYAGEVEHFTVEKRYIRKGGSILWAETTVYLVRLPNGKVISRVGLVQDISDRKCHEATLQNLVAGTAATTGEDFFPALVRHLSTALQVPIALVTQFVGQELQSLAFFADGELQPNFTYDLPETPCVEVVVEYSDHCPHSLSERFPNHPHQVRNMESYLGVALRDCQGQVLGSLCIFDRQPFRDPKRAKQILDIFGSRAGVELERQRTEQAMEHLNRELEVRVQERTAQLAASEDRLKTLFDQTADAIFLLEEQRFIDCNQAAVDLLRYSSKKDLLALRPDQISPKRQPDGQLSRSKAQSVLQDALKQCCVQFEWVHQRADGENFWAEVSLTPIHYQDKIIFHGIVRDIGDRKAVEESLRESEAKFRTLLSNLDGVVYRCQNDADWTMEFMSDAIVALSGYPASYFIHNCNRTYASIIHPEDVDMVEQIANQRLIHRQSISIEYRIIHRDGSVHWVTEKAKGIYDDDGHVQYIEGVIFDISDRKAYEARLEQTNAELVRATQMKDKFLATMSHELRTPLNAILGMTEILQEEIFGTLNARQLSALSTIEQNGHHLLNLINDILDLSKISADKLELSFTPTNIAELCHTSLQLIQQQAQQKKLQIQTAIPTGIPPILIDAKRINQVLINLLSNAIKFTPEGGQIALIVHPSSVKEATGTSTEPFLQIAVNDTGIGIASEHLEQIFQPFVQIDSALNRQYEGTGLGLALVKQIVERHTGQVRVTSIVGVGSSFTVELPWVVPTLPSVNISTVPEKDITQPPLTRPTLQTIGDQLILLVGDDAANRITISNYLTAKGYRFAFTDNGQAAIEFIQTLYPDLILMDTQMPIMDGLEATKYIRQVLGLMDIPIVALTALAMKGDQSRCLEAGANAYMSKPIKLKRLEEVLKHYLPD